MDPRETYGTPSTTRPETEISSTSPLKLELPHRPENPHVYLENCPTTPLKTSENCSTSPSVLVGSSFCRSLSRKISLSTVPSLITTPCGTPHIPPSQSAPRSPPSCLLELETGHRRHELVGENIPETLKQILKREKNKIEIPRTPANQTSCCTTSLDSVELDPTTPPPKSLQCTSSRTELNWLIATPYTLFFFIRTKFIRTSSLRFSKILRTIYMLKSPYSCICS